MQNTNRKYIVYMLLPLILPFYMAGCKVQNDDGEPTPPTRPVADAGVDKISWRIITTYLDGENSYDPDSALLSYLWEFITIPGASDLSNDDISNANKATAGFIADVLGFYTCRLTVNNGKTTDTDEVIVEIRSFHPHANAGADQTVVVDEEVFLDGNGSTTGTGDEGEILAFYWEFVTIAPGSALMDTDITDPGTATPSFIPDITGEFVVQLTVDDGYYTDSDTVSLFVLETLDGVITVDIE